MGIEDVISKIKEYDPVADFDLIKKAFNFAQAKHDGQVRLSGEPYIVHPLEVSSTLAGLRLDPPTIAAAILHDTIEDTSATLEEIQKNFGPEVASLVDGVTKLTALSESKRTEEGIARSASMLQAENLRKIFLAMAKDIRVILIKLADRLHNLKTLASLPAARQKAIGRETLEIYAPIASRLGIWRIKSEIEDLAFKCIEPERFRELEEMVRQKQSQGNQVIQEAIEILKQNLDEHKIKGRIEGRAKHIFSIHEKITKRGVNFEDIFDLIAIRVIVNSVDECYAVLGTVHSIWIPFMNKIKDYIGSPKPNGYRSLHTSVIGPQRSPLEIQIRTWEMHQMNEFGVAAHWAYKEGKKAVNLAREIYPWIRYLLDWEVDSRDASEYVKNLKLDLLKEDVFVFTPKGDVINLPAGSTPIDFSYRIHTDVGNHMVAAKVNAKVVPLNYQLENADVVEVITAKRATPSLDWLRICKSRHAKNKIRNWFKKERLGESIDRGRAMLYSEFKRAQMESSMEDKNILNKVLRKLGFSRFDDLLASIGYGETSVNQVLNRYKEAMPPSLGEILLPSPHRKVRKKAHKAAPTIKIEGLDGLDNMLVSFSRCCSPLPGDDVFGYVTIGKGISMHRTDCPNLVQLRLQPERILKANWAGNEGNRFPVQIRIDAWDRQGLLSDVMSVVNKMGIPALRCEAKAVDKMAKIEMDLELENLKELKLLFDELNRLKGNLRVERTLKFSKKT